MKMFKQKTTVQTPESNKVDTFIGASTIFKGTLEVGDNACVCIDGMLEGEIKSNGVVIVSKSGHMDASVDAECVVVNGCIKGHVTARKQLKIGESGKVVGDVEAQSMSIAMGGVLDGSCKMLDAQGNLPQKGTEAQPIDEEPAEMPPRRYTVPQAEQSDQMASVG